MATSGGLLVSQPVIELLLASSGVEARDAAKHSEIYRAACNNRNYPAQNVGSAKIEKH